MTGTAEPRAGQIWCHYKGGRYAVFGVATHSETGERLVIYRPLAEDAADLAARPLSMWHETVGDRPRFVPEASIG